MRRRRHRRAVSSSVAGAQQKTDDARWRNAPHNGTLGSFRKNEDAKVYLNRQTIQDCNRSRLSD